MTSLRKHWSRVQPYYWLLVGNLLPLFVASI